MKIIRNHICNPLFRLTRPAFRPVKRLRLFHCLWLMALLAPTALAQSQVVVINAASFASDNVLAPDSVAAAFGAFKTQNDQAYVAPGIPLPTTLGGVKVTIGGTDAQLLFTSNTQINLIIPGNLPDGTATVTVTNADNSTRTGTITIVRASPGIFTVTATGQGVPVAQTTDGTSPLQNVFNNDGSPRDVSAGTAVAPNYLALYGTGFRNAPAANPNDASRVAEAVTATIQGIPADVLYAGPQGTFTGIDQINLRIPPQLAGLGLVRVRLSVNGRVANVTTIRIGGTTPGVTTQTITPTAAGVTVNGVLTPASQVLSGSDGRTYFFDAYRFTATAGSSIAVAVNSNQFDAVVTLYKVSTGDNLTFIASDDQTGALGNGGDALGNGNALLLSNLPGAGDYVIFVSSADSEANAVGSYTMSVRTGVVQAISYGNPPTSPAITTSDVQTSGGDYLDVYSFSGTQGDQVVITMSSTAFDSFLILNQSNGELLDFDDNSGGGLNARITRTLPETGTYYIIATPFQPNVTGAYTLTLTKTNAPAAAEAFAEAASPLRPSGRAPHDAYLTRSRNLEFRYAVRRVTGREE
ncbi:MAG TPA: pre-peptidase C-terminal domain-containing protein [Blastocatellia bacterium]|nr:pre-peptidase C-terminal domain-containing protein [Blastocatellia bacterium]